MLTISIAFDQEFGPDITDPLGKLAISDGRSSILIEATYLDSWLAALVEVLSQLRNSNQAEVEVAEEPDRLKVNVAQDGRVVISHKNGTVIAETAEDFEIALKEAAGSFIEAITGLPESNRNPGIELIRKFASG